MTWGIAGLILGYILIFFSSVVQFKYDPICLKYNLKPDYRLLYYPVMSGIIIWIIVYSQS